MKKRTLKIIIPLITGMLCSNLAFADAVGASVGFHGIAIDYQKAFSDHLSSRFIFSDMPLERDMEEDDIDYSVEYDRTNLGVLLDYYPMSGSFHITGGIFTGDHNLILEANSSSGDFEIGDKTYTSSNLHLKAEASFAKAAPYVGLGWGNNIGDSGFTGNFDIGFLYVGEPTVSYEASGTVMDGGNEVNVTSFAEFQGNLEKERANLEDDLEDFKVMFIIQTGFAFRF